MKILHPALHARRGCGRKDTAEYPSPPPKKKLPTDWGGGGGGGGSFSNQCFSNINNQRELLSAGHGDFRVYIGISLKNLPPNYLIHLKPVLTRGGGGGGGVLYRKYLT